MGLFSFIGGLLGGNKAKKASSAAEAAQIAAYERGIAEQARQFDVTNANYAPYREAGLGGLTNLADLIGVNGADAQGRVITGLRDGPLYQSLYRNGEEAVLANASATGGIRGGNTQRSLYELGEDTLSRVIQNQIANFGGLASIGQNATGAVAQFGQERANNVTQLIGQQGQARADGLLTRGGINSRMWGNAGSALDGALSFIPGIGKIFG